MLDPKQQAEYDQAVAFMSEQIPRTLKRFYDGCLEQGFSETQAFNLTVSYLKIWFPSSHTGGEQQG